MIGNVVTERSPCPPAEELVDVIGASRTGHLAVAVARVTGRVDPAADDWRIVDAGDVDLDVLGLGERGREDERPVGSLGDVTDSSLVVDGDGDGLAVPGDVGVEVRIGQVRQVRQRVRHVPQPPLDRDEAVPDEGDVLVCALPVEGHGARTVRKGRAGGGSRGLEEDRGVAGAAVGDSSDRLLHHRDLARRRHGCAEELAEGVATERDEGPAVRVEGVEAADPRVQPDVALLVLVVHQLDAAAQLGALRVGTKVTVGVAIEEHVLEERLVEEQPPVLAADVEGDITVVVTVVLGVRVCDADAVGLAHPVAGGALRPQRLHAAAPRLVDARLLELNLLGVRGGVGGDGRGARDEVEDSADELVVVGVDEGVGSALHRRHL
eukprot:711943-Hanusia_phi.AAC.5